MEPLIPPPLLLLILLACEHKLVKEIVLTIDSCLNA